MMNTVTIILLPLAGFLIGFFVTMVGAGGGAIALPVLVLFFHIPTKVAVATSLAIVVPTTFIGSLSHYKEKNLNLTYGLLFGFGGLIGAYIGAYLSTTVSDLLLERIFGVFILAFGLPMVIASRRRASKLKTTQRVQVENVRLLSLAGIIIGLVFGFFSGVMTGLLGISGSPPVIAGLYLIGLPAKMIVGTSVFALFFNAVSGLISHLEIGNLNLSLLSLLGLGAVIGAFFGPRYLSRLKDNLLERVYGPFFILIILGAGIAMLIGL
jgi:uncharacterized membrane protein YfcA